MFLHEVMRGKEHNRALCMQCAGTRGCLDEMALDLAKRLLPELARIFGDEIAAMPGKIEIHREEAVIEPVTGKERQEFERVMKEVAEKTLRIPLPAAQSIEEFKQGAKTKRINDEYSHFDKCPTCGWGRVHIKARQRVGCADCYEYLAHEVHDLVGHSSQPKEVHVGKMPPRAARVALNKHIKHSMQRAYQMAVAKEDYTKAEEIKGQMGQIG